RTIDDVAALREYVERLKAERAADGGAPVVGAVVGGGLLGLEAAGALQALGASSHVVEFAPRLMPLQVDEGGGEALKRLVENLGVTVHVGAKTTRVIARRASSRRTGAVGAMEVEDAAGGNARRLPADVVVFAAGIRPRDELARAAGLEIGPRGGVVVD